MTPASRGGSTLTEVLVALMIMSIGLVSLAVLFPMSVVPINVGRPRSVRLVEDLLGRERALVGVVSQRSPDVVASRLSDRLTAMGLGESTAAAAQSAALA